MAEITTTAQAPSNPTPPSPLTTAAPATQPAAPRAGSISVEQYNAMAPAERDQIAILRAEGGGQQYVRRDALGKEPAADGNQSGTAAVEDGKLRLGDLVLDAADVQKLMTESAAREARKATMPVDAASYSLDLPADFKMPEGVQFSWAVDHPVQGPLIAQAKEFAFANGIDQAGFSKMMSMYVAAQTHKMQMVQKAVASEISKLGTTGPARVDAVTTFLRGTIGDDKLTQSITSHLFTAQQVTAFERLIQKVTSQGHASFSQSGREVSDGPGRVSEEAYAKMSPGQRLDYSRSFDQRQFHNR